MHTGLDRVANAAYSTTHWQRCGLLSNQSSITDQGLPAWQVLHQSLGERLVALFGPQHGFVGTAQYNMDETDHGIHRPSQLPIYSLYGEHRQPTADMLSCLDTLVIDLQITGCRIYTWKATIYHCLLAAKQCHKRIVILDRPNPLGGVLLEGRVLDEAMHSFVGCAAMPLRHGLTTGEAAQWINRTIEADLEVVTLQNWQPAKLWHELNRPWMFTSPMLPHVEPVYLYPGMVLLEGTQLSEGRGTALPFQCIGAPYIDHQWLDYAQSLAPWAFEGIQAIETAFVPTWNKWQQQACQGLCLLVTNPHKIRSVALTLALVRSAYVLYPQAFAWQPPGYEYDYHRLPWNLLIGHAHADQKLQADNFCLSDDFWNHGVEDYASQVQPYLLYPRQQFLVANK